MYKTLKISEELHEAFKEFARIRGHTVVWLLEKIIREFLESHKSDRKNIPSD